MSNFKNHAKQRPRTMPKRCLRNALSAEWASKTCGGPLWNVKHQRRTMSLNELPKPLRPKPLADRLRNSRTAAGFVSKPTKNKRKKVAKGRLKQGTAQRKTWKPASHQAKRKKKVFGARMRKGRTPAGLAPKPLPNCSRKNAETSLLEPIKTERKIVPKPCETAARKLPKRCFCYLLLKTKKKPASHQASVQSLWPTASETAEKQNPSRFCAQAIAKPQPEKCRNVAFGTH